MLEAMLSKSHNSGPRTEHTLREFLDGLPRGQIKAFAERVGVGNVHLSQLAARLDGRVPSPKLCVQIERASYGAVSRRSLRPDDWGDLWPELIDAANPWPVKEAA